MSTAREVQELKERIALVEQKEKDERDRKRALEDLQDERKLMEKNRADEKLQAAKNEAGREYAAKVHEAETKAELEKARIV